MEQQEKDAMKYLLIASIISADNDEFSEEVKQEVIHRLEKDKTDFEYILQPLLNNGLDKEQLSKLIELLNKL